MSSDDTPSEMTDPHTKIFSRLHMKWVLAGLALSVTFFVMALISPAFAYKSDMMARPITALVILMIFAGILYLVIVLTFRDKLITKGLLAWILAVGLLLRLAMFASTPMLEDDYFRYLWDGGVLAHGFNPYQYSPEDIVGDESSDIPGRLRSLALESSPVAQRVNHAGLRTIYPPVAQAAFAASHYLRPWSLMSWRVVLLIFDVASLCMIIYILQRLKLSPVGAAIYWWNPLLVKEIYNSGHMDMIIFPFLLGVLLLIIQRRHVLAAGVLGLAVGVKFWPVILLPIILRPLMREPRRLIIGLLFFGIISISMFSPIYFAGLDSESGFAAYSIRWEMNDTLFMLILWAARFVIGAVNMEAGLAQAAARATVICILTVWIGWNIKKDEKEPSLVADRFLLVIAALFLLSPTQFPWYFLWMLPYLAVRPRASLMLFTALLPLYYLRFYLQARGSAHLFDNYVVWLEFVPVWCLIFWEWLRNREKRPILLAETA